MANAPRTSKLPDGFFDKLAKMQVGRDATIVAFGGGVVGDLAGFVAATYMRGIALIQIPTTLLAQVDSSVGGKTGVDLSAGKNLVGAFYQPKLVLADVNVLETLPHREILNGLAEVVKYAIIKSPEIFKALEKTGADLKGIEAVIGECVRIKAEVVSKDEREISGLRMILNLGHTVGHALETHFGYHVLNHGEAVALGILAETEIARRLKLIGQKDAARIAALIAKLGFATKLAKLPAKKIIHLMQLDKKVRGKKVNYVLLSTTDYSQLTSCPRNEHLSKRLP